MESIAYISTRACDLAECLAIDVFKYEIRNNLTLYLKCYHKCISAHVFEMRNTHYNTVNTLKSKNQYLQTAVSLCSKSTNDESFLFGFKA